MYAPCLGVMLTVRRGPGSTPVLVSQCTMNRWVIAGSAAKAASNCASVGGLNEYGGTSFVDPQMNGATAVIDSYLGHRVGFWNPYLYAAAGGTNSPFTQLDQAGTSNDNIYYTGNPGEPYNEGIGLGEPNLARLAGDFGG